MFFFAARRERAYPKHNSNLLDAHMYECAVFHDAVGGELGPGITGVWMRPVGLIFLGHDLVWAWTAKR